MATNSNQVSGSQTSTSHVTSQNQKPKQFSRGKQTGAHTGTTSGNSGQSNRNAKRARWAKKNRPVAKPVVQRGPVFEYICECHSEPAKKPRAGTKSVSKDPESGKMKDTFSGLGKWRCATTGKRCKVTVRKPQAKTVSPNVVELVTQEVPVA